ncbi:hypothetical protein [Thiobacillus denitrificans]|uniref:hypothetical protein n=1 Tax=Thiobacillus denitrificans TaxID=36861 RepID=UPI00036481F0|nr:hypothetical protein [Thiobacillus denitrificans]
MSEIKPSLLPQGNVLIYEYGARLDKDCIQAVGDQIIKSRRLYNDLVATIRGIVTEMKAFVLEKSGPDAQRCQEEIDALNAAFDAARAENNEDAMKCIAESRREKWRELAVFVKEARKNHRSDIQSMYLSRIGKNSACETYRIRSKAVADGLGWATANQVLDAALTAFKKSFARGNAPRFAVGEDKDQDTLTLQFTAAGGVPVDTILAGKHGEVALSPTNGCGPRKYGELRFRLGAAKAATNATGTWQYHRPLPDGATAGLCRLIRRRVGKDYKWAIQMQVKRPPIEQEALAGRKPLVAVHFGWAANDEGRCVAGITDGADPGQAYVLKLPAEVEQSLVRSSAIQSERDSARDAIVPRLKEIEVPDMDIESVESLPPDSPEVRLARAADELKAIHRLPANHVAIRRLHRLCGMLRDVDFLPEWLEDWRKEDRLQWQSAAHIARRARNTRKGFYRQTAIDLARQYSSIVLEPLDLAKAAVKIDEITGERTEFAKKARAGRVVAALYELESAIRWAAAKAGSAMFELTGETASRCSICGGDVLPDETNGQLLHCTECGADLDRKQNGAAMAWQLANDDLESLVEAFWTETFAARRSAENEQAEKKQKMAEGRRKARTPIGGENTEVSRDSGNGANA